MTEDAKRVYEIAKRNGYEVLLENSVDDLDEYAEGIDTDNEQEVLDMIYRAACTLI